MRRALLFLALVAAAILAVEMIAKYHGKSLCDVTPSAHGCPSPTATATR